MRNSVDFSEIKSESETVVVVAMSNLLQQEEKKTHFNNYSAYFMPPLSVVSVCFLSFPYTVHVSLTVSASCLVFESLQSFAVLHSISRTMSHFTGWIGGGLYCSTFPK